MKKEKIKVCKWIDAIKLFTNKAVVYEVTTGALNQAAKRNKERFPEDFRFQIIEDEFSNLKSQIVISSSMTGHGGKKDSRMFILSKGFLCLPVFYIPK